MSRFSLLSSVAASAEAVSFLFSTDPETVKKTQYIYQINKLCLFEDKNLCRWVHWLEWC